jgi:hypothetical protein
MKKINILLIVFFITMILPFANVVAEEQQIPS